MKYIHQFLIIMLISFIGELLNILLPLPIPASVYGLLILLFGLFTNMIQLHHIEDVADWLILIDVYKRQLQQCLMQENHFIK